MIALAIVLLASSDPQTVPQLDRALAYLAREVPRWQRENQCYSCHNNGDAARALYTARRLQMRVPAIALADTTAWVSQPARWDSNRGNPASSDKNLARIQFAASLADAFDAGIVKDRAVFRKAAESLLGDQQADGSWQVDAGGSLGSPVTYGPYLATYMARRTLEKADRERFAEAITKADAWFDAAQPSATLDRAALLLAQPRRVMDPIDAQLPSIFLAQNPDGGWGPYRHSPSEAFDTAVVLLALDAVKESMPQVRETIARGREWLLKNQLDTGDWLETTRPAGSQSYAQHISTAGWATLALLLTAPSAP